MANTFVAYGTLITDVEQKGGGPVTARFVVDSVRDSEESMFFGLKFWDKNAEIAEKFLKKGRKILVSGQLSRRSYKDKDYWDISVHSFDMNLGGSPPQNKTENEKTNGEDIPF